MQNAILLNPDDSQLLKRTFATQTYKCTKDIELVKTLMGHSNISITDRYVNTDLDSMKYKYSSAM